ncbi:hypothetical protein L207DRAFT_586113 [Hyaloscypha variabilis F]|uniref:Rhodopsin domain-containing protein n=1 Tax=Hyaloscypha variabilis (strain UAMH 11265 / GT02V1 / F) TaxID=1149755 RepID=A0A2J6RGX2_HYAVF|nr:hypothetical protein L207DRAFT_586113 [Hyaloscypha variabilis F]
MNSTSIVGAFPPPPGTTANFTNPEYTGARLVVAAIVCPAIAIPFMLIRLYTKHFLLKRLHLDDYAITLGMLCAFANSGVGIYQTRNGLGIQIWNVPLDKYIKFLKVGSTYGAITFSVGMLCIKASIALFYLRFSLDRSFRIVTYIVLFVSVTFALLGAFSFAYLCKPIEKFWNFTVPGTCGNFGANLLTFAVLDVITDVTLLLLPIWLLWPLKLERIHKIGTVLIFMTGSFVCCVSIIRLVELLRTSDYKDWECSSVENLIWCLIELYTGIICACLPSLKPFSKFHFPFLHKKHQEVAVRSLNTFSAASNIDSQQQGGHIFSSAADSAYESGGDGRDLEARSYGSSDLSRSVNGRHEHENRSNFSSQAPA